MRTALRPTLPIAASGSVWKTGADTISFKLKQRFFLPFDNQSGSLVVVGPVRAESQAINREDHSHSHLPLVKSMARKATL
jgi:hypothetical protein